MSGIRPTHLSYSGSLSLPNGWRRVEALKHSGITAGKISVYYISPQGIKVTTRSELASQLGKSFDLRIFDWNTGKFDTKLLRKRASNMIDNNYHRSKQQRFDPILSQPIRQTASISRQNVTVVKNHDDTERRELKISGNAHPPRQLFWMKRLEHMSAVDKDLHRLRTPSIPQIKPVGFNDQSLLSVIQQMMSKKQLNPQQRLVGQTTHRTLLEKRPEACIDPTQPFVQPLIVTEKDLMSQQQRVETMRQKLKKQVGTLEMKASLENN